MTLRQLERKNAMDKDQLRGLDIHAIRAQIRSGAYTGDTMGVADGQVQANLVVLPKEVAFEFMVFCQRNPKPCPLLDVTLPGSPVPALLAPGSDIRTDLPRYRVFRDGELVDEPKLLLEARCHFRARHSAKDGIGHRSPGWPWVEK